MCRFLRQHGPLIAILVLCFAVRLGAAWVGASDDALAVDPDGYWEIAGNLASGNGFAWRRSVGLRSRLHGEMAEGSFRSALVDYAAYRGRPPGRYERAPTAMRPPLYPLLLATVRGVAGDRVRVALAFQSLLDVATCWLVYLLGRRLFERKTALLSAGVWALHPVSISQATQFWTEPLCALLLTAALLALARPRARGVMRHGAAGILLGLATLTRPASLVAAAFLALCEGLRARRREGGVGGAMVMAGTLALVLTPWLWRNRALHGAPTLGVTTHSGYTLFLGNAVLDEGVWWRQVEAPYARRKARQLLDRHLDSMSARAVRRVTVPMLQVEEVGRDRLYRLLGYRQMRSHPVRYLALSALRVPRLWFNVGYGHWPSRASWGVAAVNAALLVLACVGWVKRKSRRAAMMPLVLVALSQTLVYAFIIAYVRFIVPVMPGVIVLAAAGVTSLLRGASSRPVRAADAPPPAAS